MKLGSDAGLVLGAFRASVADIPHFPRLSSAFLSEPASQQRASGGASYFQAMTPPRIATNHARRIHRSPTAPGVLCETRRSLAIPDLLDAFHASLGAR